MWYMDSTTIFMDSLVYFMDGSGPAPLSGLGVILYGTIYTATYLEAMIAQAAAMEAAVYTQTTLRGRFKC